MSALVKIEGKKGALQYLNGRYGRLLDAECSNDTCVVEFSDTDIKQKLGTNKFRLFKANVILVTGITALIEQGLPLSVWSYLSADEKAIAIKLAINVCRDELYEDFESYIKKTESLNLLDAFIEKTMERMQTHNHYGAKAIFEDLRYHSELKDGSELFKVNNNYTASLSRIVMAIFPEANSIFEKREAGNKAVA